MKNLNRHLVAAAFVLLAVILFFSIRRSASSREEETLREDNAAEVPTPPESSLAGAPEPTEQQMMEQVAQAKRDDALRYSREELSTARHFMNRDGARAKITLKIIDQEGAPVVGATIKAYFTQPEGSSNSALVTGASDENGLFTMEKLTKYQCRWEISKKGFYETQGRYEWQSKFTMEAYRTKRWQPWNPTIEVVLKDVRNPIEMEEHNITLKMPVNVGRFGFDFMKGDWVEPYGEGRDVDVWIESILNPKTKDLEAMWEHRLIFVFPNEGDGFIRYTQEGFSQMRTPYEAPVEGYVQQISFICAGQGHTVHLDTRLKDNEGIVFRVRTQKQNERFIGGLHGLSIGTFQFPAGPYARANFQYRLNPNIGDRNLEAK